ncbi:MAG: serine hydrolase [Cyclobacteriaceae bacterium]
MHKHYLAVIFMAVSMVVVAQKSPQLPITDADPLPLRNRVDQKFQSKFENKLNSNPKWKKLISQKKMAVGLVDLRNPNDVRFARVNSNVMMYAASLPKIAILLAAMDAIEKDELQESDEVLNDIKIMISKSDNAASTRMIDRLGYEKIERVLTDPKYEFYDEDFGGGLWVGKRYAASGEKNPDPILGLSHAATVSQVCRFYYLMAYGRLVSEERSKQMLDVMVDPALHHKFVGEVEKLAPQAKMYRKSGTWRNFHSDSILVWGPNRRYILVALLEDEDGSNTLKQLVKVVDDLLKSEKKS